MLHALCTMRSTQYELFKGVFLHPTPNTFFFGEEARCRANTALKIAEDFMADWFQGNAKILNCGLRRIFFNMVYLILRKRRNSTWR
jgi:hypothetical protein